MQREIAATEVHSLKIATILAFAAGAIVVCTMLSACGSEQPSESNHIGVVSRDLGINPSESNHIGVVSRYLGMNQLGIEASHLSEMPNPKGEGTFVYVPQTRYSGVERYVIWLVIENRAFALNGVTKIITPSLPWPREAPDDLWQRTGLEKFSATEAIQIVFG